MASSWILFFSYQDDARSNKHQIRDLPTGVASPSLSLNTISVCPSIRNLGGRFPRTASATKHIANRSPNLQHSQTRLRPFSLTLQVQLLVRDFSIFYCLNHRYVHGNVYPNPDWLAHSHIISIILAVETLARKHNHWISLIFFGWFHSTAAHSPVPQIPLATDNISSAAFTVFLALKQRGIQNEYELTEELKTN